MTLDLDDLHRIEEALAETKQTTTPLYYRVQRCQRAVNETRGGRRRQEPNVTTETDWTAWIEEGRFLWNWTVQRRWKGSHVVSRGDHLTGWSLTEKGARKKARKWLANRIAWSSPKPDQRRFVSLAESEQSDSKRDAP
jgi:hypothetical protein